jgi:hypothetical protein
MARAPKRIWALTAVASILGLTLVFADSAWAAFGIEKFEYAATNEVGSPDTQAGSHPYEMTTTFELNHHEAEGRLVPDGDPRNVEVDLPPGEIANPNATTTKCAESELERNLCPNSSAVGTVAVRFNLVGPLEAREPVFNVVPPPGTPGELGFNLAGLGIVVHIAGNLDASDGYRLSAKIADISQTTMLYGATLTLWGAPSDPRHDEQRGECLGENERAEEEELQTGEPKGRSTCPSPITATPFLTLPSSCPGTPPTATMRAASWQEPGIWTALRESSPAAPAISGCNRLPFSPELTVTPDSEAAETPSGLSVDLKFPREETLSGLAEADLKDAVVTLPAGMALSLPAVDGRAACTPEEIGLSGAGIPTCPEASKLGDVEILTPLLEHPLAGSVYLAQQGNGGAQQGANPFGSLLALYLVAEGSGVPIKLAGRVEADPTTGQLTMRFEGNPPLEGEPQLPFSDLKLHFFGGARAPLVTPPTCGVHETTASFVPWSDAGAAMSSTSFSTTSGPDGEPCPSGQFAPSFIAGTTNNQAGSFSPFTMTLSRHDGEARFAGVQLQLPPGLLWVLASVGQCPELQASQGTCPLTSQIGHATVGAGAGPEQLFLPQAGKPEDPVYLTGPYRGAPFGLSIVVPAEAGPFNLGTVVTRAKIEVDPHTAQLLITSDPLPTILDGIPLDLRTINVTVDRAGFVFNPTNCAPLTVGGTIASIGGPSAVVSSPFHAVNCAQLPFNPQITASAQANTGEAASPTPTPKTAVVKAKKHRKHRKHKRHRKTLKARHTRRRARRHR